MEATPIKRTRGRPRKEKVIDDTPKLPRGRPRKEKVIDDTPKRPRGRPRKEKVIDDTPKQPRGRPRIHPIRTTPKRQYRKLGIDWNNKEQFNTYFRNKLKFYMKIRYNKKQPKNELQAKIQALRLQYYQEKEKENL